MKHKSYIITGPTASGKSDFAHNLARRNDGVIINCDSVQMYKAIENISASPFAGRDARDGVIDSVPYKLFSFLDLSNQISVADYLDLAAKEYKTALSDARPVIFVGGSGYYINVLLNGISDIPSVSETSRNRARAMVSDDIIAARNLLPADFLPTDKQRVSRALEVFFETGRHLSDWQNDQRTGAISPAPFKILINPPREILLERIANRIPEMINGGALIEAKNIIKNNLNESRAIGAAELCKFLRGEITENIAIQNWITKTNQYAKRQRTWFKTKFLADLEISDVASDDDIKKLI